MLPYSAFVSCLKPLELFRTSCAPIRLRNRLTGIFCLSPRKLHSSQAHWQSLGGKGRRQTSCWKACSQCFVPGSFWRRECAGPAKTYFFFQSGKHTAFRYESCILTECRDGDTSSWICGTPKTLLYFAGVVFCPFRTLYAFCGLFGINRNQMCSRRTDHASMLWL